MKIGYAATGLFLIVTLTAGLAPAPVSASDHNLDKERPIRLYASAHIAPIGTLRINSPIGGDVAINGRIPRGDELIWGGELIKVFPARTARVTLDSIGQVTLSRGAVVRFSSFRASHDDAESGVLVASLVEGSIGVKLNAGAGAYVEAGASAFTASRGASFTVRVEEGRASLNTVAGVVGVRSQAPPQDLNIRVVDDLGRPVSSGSQLSVRARSTRQVQVQVTDKNDKPIPDLPVLFSLADPCLGSLGLGALAGATLVQKTDKRGIAAVPLIAGAARCAGSIIAKVEGTNVSVSIQTRVQPNARFWNTQNTVLVVVAVAAAGIVTGFLVSNSGSRQAITPVPPPGVKP
jgi:hypothetical protein